MGSNAWAEVYFTNLNINLTAVPQIGDSVTFAATASNSDEGDVFYQFDLIPNYGTDDYDPMTGFTTMQDFSTSNTCTHTFTEADGYILIVKASNTTGELSGAAPIFGGSIYVNPSTQTTYGIGHTSRSFRGSPGSSGDLPVEIYYPAESAGTDTQISSGQFPVIIFAHGYQQSYLDYAYVWEEMVPAGYIVAFLNRLNSSATINIDDYALDIEFALTKIKEMGNDTTSSFYEHLGTAYALMGHYTGGGAIFIAASNPQSNTSANAVTIAIIEEAMAEISLEAILDLDVSIATKYALSAEEAPSIVSVITAAEIKNMDARNIVDVLRTVPGPSPILPHA